ncbi:MAG TPA: FIST N-terminal domain-containing protein [Candidatus Bathyarchaeia archaeon]|nr:FIST N-terminal domain-containing protein [Candidatus Bathyarchaeia archaeon]
MQTRAVVRGAAAISAFAEAERAGRDVAEQVIRALGTAEARAVIYFATTHHAPAYDRIERAITSLLSVEHVVGCSAGGVVGAGREIERAPGVSALALAGDFEVKRFFISSLRGRAEEVGREVGRVVGSLERPRSVVLFADTYNLAPDELLAGIASVAPDARVFGAGASEDGSLGETAVFARSTTAANAVSGLALGGIQVRTLITQACRPVGAWQTITRAEQNRILELDGRPALEQYLAVLPEMLRADLKQALRSTLAALAIELTIGELAPPYVVRDLLGADPERGALLVGDEVISGMRFAVAIRDPAGARQALEARLAQFARTENRLAAALYFNCFARGEVFYGVPEIDSAYIQRSLGTLAVAGLFSGAEFAPLGGTNRLQQYSGVLVGLEGDGRA